MDTAEKAGNGGEWMWATQEVIFRPHLLIGLGRVLNYVLGIILYSCSGMNFNILSCLVTGLYRRPFVTGVHNG